MHVVIPHVGKSHLTRETVLSIPDSHTVVLVDGSYVADMDTLAQNLSHVRYVRPEPLGCLAFNWNEGAAAVPPGEPYWMFCASDIQFGEHSWRRVETLLKNYPDAGIIRDGPTNWNVWIVRRWAWDLLKPMDERYKPCGGEDDDVVMKCQAAGIKILAARMGVNHLEGGHATRLDIRRELAGTTWSGRHANIALFKEKWDCIPSKGRDHKYAAAMAETHISERRSEPPSREFTPPQARGRSKDSPKRGWPSPLHINLGCGIKPIEGFVNVDAVCRLADVKIDIVHDEWPWEPGTVDRIETYHMIEHLDQSGGMILAQKAFDALKPGGVLVIECPDLNKIAKKYPRSTRLMRRMIYGESTTKWRAHRWGYCPATMRLLLEQVGFAGGKIVTGNGTDYHVTKIGFPCMRAEATK